MTSKQNNYYLWGGIVLAGLIFLVLFYVGQARNWVVDLYANKATNWLTNFMEWIYPRFFTEKNRFPLSFFLQKADQVVGRFVVAVLGCLIFLWFYRQHQSEKDVASSDVSAKTWRLLGAYFCVLAMIFTWDWYIELSNLYEARFFYQPVFLLKILYVPFPTPQSSLILCVLMWLSALGVALGGKWQVYSATVFAVLFVVLQGFQLSFHKIDHTFALFTYWACLMPFGCVAGTDRKFVLKAIQFAIALPYTIAGIEKIAVGGTAWFEPYTFQAYLRLHGQSWGLWLAQFSGLCMFLGIAMLFFEVFFLSVVFFKWARLIFLPLGIIFHIGTYTLLNVGALIHPWWLCYGVFFFNFEKKPPH